MSADAMAMIIFAWVICGIVVGLFVGLLWDSNKLPHPQVVGSAAGLLVPLTLAVIAVAGAIIAASVLCREGSRRRRPHMPRAEVVERKVQP